MHTPTPRPRPTPPDPLGVSHALDAVDARVRSIACGLTEAQAGWRSPRGGPSVAVALAGHREALLAIVPPLRHAVGDVRTAWRARLGRVRSAWWWRLVPLVVERLPWRARVAAPAPPAGALRQLMTEILTLHAEVRALAREGERRDLRTATVPLAPLPALPTLHLPLDVALALVPAMARRHLRSAERVRLDPRFPRY